MRIAQVAPLTERVPPVLYGGTERIVSYLTNALIALGHDVTLFASGDSVTRARLVSPCPRALRLSKVETDPVPVHTYQLELVAARAHEFDIIHFHTDWGHIPIFSRLHTPFLTTLHGRLDLPCVDDLLQQFEDAAVVSISESQRLPVPRANWRATVPHGLPPDLLQPRFGPGQYLAFLGRICPDKRPDIAIHLARTVGLPIRLAAKVDRKDEDYFKTVIRPLLKLPGVEFIDEIGEADKASFLGNAIALLFPIGWPEPFGLVMIEAMACGTPVVAMRRGSVPEIIRDGVTGYAVENELEFLAAIDRVVDIPRLGIRAEFDRRFTSERMARAYVRAYEALIPRSSASPNATQHIAAFQGSALVGAAAEAVTSKLNGAVRNGDGTVAGSACPTVMGPALIRNGRRSLCRGRPCIDTRCRRS